MLFFTLASLILFLATLIFYVIFFSLTFYWHERKTSLVVVPIIYTFDFFVVGFLVVCLISLLVAYIPAVAHLFS